MIEPNPVFEAALAGLSDRHRDDVLTAFAALEHSAEPVNEAQLPGLRDATLRRSLQSLLHQVGRILVQHRKGDWTTGYRDEVAAQITGGRGDGVGNPLPPIDRAVLTFVLIHSVAIPRSRGSIDADTWVSPHLTSNEEILKHSRLPREETRAALGRLRASGLLVLDRRRNGYLPGPQFHRLTPAARARLQEELILAAGPDTPVAAAIRHRRRTDPGET